MGTDVKPTFEVNGQVSPHAIFEAAEQQKLPQRLALAVALHSDTGADARKRFALACDIAAYCKIVRDRFDYNADFDLDGAAEDWVANALPVEDFRANLVQYLAEHDQHTDTHRPADYRNTGDHFAARAAHTKAQAKKANHGSD